MFCKYCGMPVQNTDRQCPHCHGVLAPTAAPAPQSTGFSVPTGGFSSPAGFDSISTPAPRPAAPVSPAPRSAAPAAPAPVSSGFAPAASGFGAGSDLPPAPTSAEAGFGDGFPMDGFSMDGFSMDGFPMDGFAGDGYSADDVPFITDTQPTRISAAKETGIFLRQNLLIMLNDWKNFCISMLFPVIAAIIVVFVCGENMFDVREATKSGDFVVVCAAIWGGLFNSIQIVVKERENIRRDYLAGVRISSQIISRVVLQFMLCVVQSFILNLCYLGVGKVHGNDLPSSGIIFGAFMVETYISIFLLMFSADMMGLMFSCLVRKSETANVMAPYILIVQLIFSGILFTLEGASEIISYIMLSRWGMEALGSSCDLAEIYAGKELALMDAMQDGKMITSDALDAVKDSADMLDMFDHTTEHLLMVWGIMIAFSVLFAVVGALTLRSVSKDKR